MSTYTSNATFADVARRISAANRIMVTSHVKPDGDAAGAALALTRALRVKGKTVDLYLMGPIEPALIPIIGDTKWCRIEQQSPGDQFDLILIVDTGSWSQLEPIAEFLKPRRETVIVIDHHPRGDDVAALRIVDATCASTTQLLVPLLDELKVDLGPNTGGVGSVAEALFIGLATDTGWFKYANANAAAFSVASRLLASGVDKPRLYQLIEENFGPERIALEARALASLEYARNGAAAIQLLRPADFTATGGAVEDLTGIVNNPMTVGQVRVSILLSQTPDNIGANGKPPVTKISFRSKPPPPGGLKNDFVDVNALAAKFGGGGHVHAAGARVNVDIDQAKATVIASLT